jgi:hypothetical protein
MRTSSAKAKGRRASQEVKDLLLKYAPDLSPADISVVPSGVTGEDLWLSPKARELYAFSPEVKNQEAINIWAAFEQAKGHAVGTTFTPVLFFRRNRSELMVCIRAEDFIKAIR